VYRGTFAIVDTRAIRHNVSSIRGLLRPDTKLLIAVKANGYGHGARRVAEAAVREGASYLGVASVEEGIALRREGVDTPILVLGAVSYTAAAVAAEHNLSVTLTPDCVEWPDQPIVPSLKVHLKVDTGMTRLGGRTPEELYRLADWVAKRPDLVCEGVFTHLACADAESLDHAEAQMRRFEAMLDVVTKAGLRPQLVHAANSAAAMRRPDWQFDMVRVGIAAYGYPPSDAFALPVELKPALNLYSFISRVSSIQPGDTVGYGATFTASRPTVVATVPVGYADGYPRLLSNRGFVLVRGKRAPVIGNVCMDQLMIDVTDIPGVERGDCVTLYGRLAPAVWTQTRVEQLGSEAEAARWLCETFANLPEDVPTLSLDELAGQIGTISYELMCALAARVPRFYVE
jgi:alanine racemase